MGKETTPSETEWLVMEVIWNSGGDITVSRNYPDIKRFIESECKNDTRAD